jgi:succinate dehydrogenase / fumarate reductase iron-sulfur subunit
MREKVITARVFRFNPKIDKNPKYEIYEIQNQSSTSVLNLLTYIHQNIDRSLAYRNYFCNVGLCRSCLLQIDGKNLRGCSKIVNPGDTVTIEPAKGYEVIRDLVVDFSSKRGN